MTKKLILLTAFLFLVFSCGTREDETDNEQYIGVWNWVSTSGGISNTQQTPANTGINKTMTLTAESVYSIKENSVVVSEGTYYLGRGVTNTDHAEKLFLHFSNSPDLIVETINGTDLYLAEDKNDGLRYHYSK
ncbi:hypothetical protein Q73A0000_00030 [Kaistella flava (ex Peng et al. 2021)]|uniref:Lipocalin-like domain-containing protein n=1 Tax=Kaistella flava (ex Peng et al. 2021) TaxID=2038776 RepID=A0A7M2Y672_9FLAO|nr:hypothetical protein [Kaistella flava (ex Peng et al. 2021)]QOW08843.1 hypothetical protein Q73A0000_00030 [Kaistella flava (ex Peng et al. 2021)]